MSVRAKFKVVSVEPAGEGVQSISLQPVVGDNDPESENSKFWKASPGGQISLFCANIAATEQFKPGRVFYVDFTPASD